MSRALRRLGTSTLSVFPLALGTNVFGWTAGESDSFAVLDAYAAAGGNLLDTSDSYSFWAPGNVGGESETIIGRWLARSGLRDEVLLATKVSQHPDYKGLAAHTIRDAAEQSLKRLGTDHIDVYYAHFDDTETPLEESIAALSGLVDSGKIRYIGVSNYTPARLRAWLEVTRTGGYHQPIVVQPQYSLMERGIEADVLPIARDAGLGLVPYYSLARGFLTGKYRAGAKVDSPRAGVAAGYLDQRGLQVLDALERTAEHHDASMTAVALAWLAAQPGVTAPIASARNLTQLDGLLESTTVTLADDELRLLDRASATPQAHPAV